MKLFGGFFHLKTAQIVLTKLKSKIKRCKNKVRISFEGCISLLSCSLMKPKLLVSKRTVINFKNTRILFKDMFRQDLCHLQFTK